MSGRSVAERAWQLLLERNDGYPDERIERDRIVLDELPKLPPRSAAVRAVAGEDE